MFRDHQLHWRAILTFGLLVATVAWFFVLLLSGVGVKVLGMSFLRFGIIAVLLYSIWQFFVRIAWRWRCFRGWLVTMPHLKGRWVGTYRSSFDNFKTLRKMTLEVISHTLLSVSCVAYTEDSRADGYSARVLSERDNQEFKLAYVYHAKREPSSSVAGDEHEGLAILRLIEGNPHRLEGTYVNDRDPQPHKGQIELQFESHEIMQHL